MPDAFREDIALNALATGQAPDFHVPVQRLHQRPSAEQVDANRLRWEEDGVSAKMS